MGQATFGKLATIVKVRAHGTGAMAIINDKDSQHVTLQSLEPKTRNAMRGDTRVFFSAMFEGDRWTIGKRLAEQFW